MVKNTTRPRSHCTQCTQWHRGTGDICRTCRVRNKADQMTGELALTGGHWVTDRRGIQRWEEAS